MLRIFRYKTTMSCTNLGKINTIYIIDSRWNYTTKFWKAMENNDQNFINKMLKRGRLWFGTPKEYQEIIKERE